MTGPIVTRRDQPGEPLSDRARCWHAHTKHHDAAVADNADRLATSPKSLSKVNRMRSSRMAHANTS